MDKHLSIRTKMVLALMLLCASKRVGDSQRKD